MPMKAMLRRRPARWLDGSAREASSALSAASRFGPPMPFIESLEPDLQRAGEGPAPPGNAGRQIEILVEQIVTGKLQLEALVERLPGHERIRRPEIVEVSADEIALSFADIGAGNG